MSAEIVPSLLTALWWIALGLVALCTAVVLVLLGIVVYFLVWWTSIRVQPPFPGAPDGHSAAKFP